MTNQTCKGRCCPAGQGQQAMPLKTICRLNTNLGFPMQIDNMQAAHIHQVNSWFHDQPTSQFLGPKFAELDFLNMLEDTGSQELVLLRNETLLGYIGFDIPDADHRYYGIHSLCINPQFRRSGLSKLLIEQTQNLYTDVDLWQASIDLNNGIAKKLFESLGWRTLGIVEGMQIWNN